MYSFVNIVANVYRSAAVSKREMPHDHDREMKNWMCVGYLEQCASTNTP
jgi:hypothetical protein